MALALSDLNGFYLWQGKVFVQVMIAARPSKATAAVVVVVRAGPTAAATPSDSGSSSRYSKKESRNPLRAEPPS